MADVEVIWPNNKKVVVPSGSSLKEAAKKAGFKPNYGCEEGKCGSCELKIAGKKIRPCTGKKIRPFNYLDLHSISFNHSSSLSFIIIIIHHHHYHSSSSLSFITVNILKHVIYKY